MKTTQNNIKVIIYCYPGMTLLDAIGPYEVLAQCGNMNIKWVSQSGRSVTADSKMASIAIDHSIQDVHQADLLIIPGSSITFVREMTDQPLMDWINKIDKTTQFTTSVCTGAFILAATGLLQGHKATTHWQSIDKLKQWNIQPVQDRYVRSGKYLTAAGVSAGIEMALELVRSITDDHTAQAVQKAIEFYPAVSNSTSSDTLVHKKALDILDQKAKAEPELLKKWEKIGS